MSWFIKIARMIPVNDMLNHAFKAIESSISGDWRIAQQRNILTDHVKYQWWGSIIVNGASVYQENDRFSLLIYGLVRRGKNEMPREFDYDVEQSNNWISSNTTRVDSFDSQESHPLVRYNVVVAGNIPGRNWQHKPAVNWAGDTGIQVPMYSIESTWREEGSSLVMLSTPYEVAEYVQTVIDKAYTDFGNDGGSDENPDVPQWPYPEGDFTEDPEDARLRGLRLRGNPSSAKNDKTMRVQLPY